MIPSPIQTVLSSIRKHQVQGLLMGGQACVLYGAAQFSRDTDLAILADDENLNRLKGALTELQAQRIAVPPFDKQYLEMGLAVHFRCSLPPAAGIRVDIMSRMRGVAPFAELWDRRTTFHLPDGAIEAMSLCDLVQAKKTQRAKDWPMIANLLEADYFRNRNNSTELQRDFWLRELRTPRLLIELCKAFPDEAIKVILLRPLLAAARDGDERTVQKLLHEEETSEREKDRQYWVPLKKELERLRLTQRKSDS